MKKEKITKAYNEIKKGGLCIIPSKVGYTLLGQSNDSICEMYNLKKRPLSKPCVILTNRELLNDIAKIPSKFINLINDIDNKNLLCGFRLYRKPHSFYKSLGKFSNKYSKDEEGTSIFVINAGMYIIHLVNQSIKDELFVIGSSANRSGEGNEGVFENIPENIRQGVDFQVEDDAFVSKAYDSTTREQGVMVDLTQNKPVIIRNGYMQEKINFIIKKY
ncbi:MAG: hypothetical protein WDZ80_05055 [Candidatus Paceibacterota bacterium]